MNLTNIFLESKETLTDKLLKRVSTYDIFCHFMGFEVKVGKVYNSPIRADKRPTFILFIPEDKDEVLFKDFAWVGGNIFKFIKLFAVYQESINLETHYDVIEYIDKKMGIGLFDTTVKKEIIRRKIDPSFYQSKRVIKFKSREFTKNDLNFWKKYHITEEVLDLFKVKSVHKLLDEQNIVKWTVSKNSLMFVFIIYNKVKLYSPEAKSEFKWRNTCPGHYIQGIEQVKALKSNNKKLIITKSLKDVMVFYTFLKDTYDVIAPHSETYLFSDKFLNYLYKKYDEIVIIYDFDLAGVRGTNILYKKNKEKFSYRFVSTERIYINGSIRVVDKDISDFSEDRPKKEILNHLKNNMRL